MYDNEFCPKRNSNTRFITLNNFFMLDELGLNLKAPLAMSSACKKGYSKNSHIYGVVVIQREYVDKSDVAKIYNNLFFS